MGAAAEPMIPTGIDWTTLERRELCPLPAPAAPWTRIVAALNVWNDVESLRLTLPTWAPFVDQVVAVDGRYRGISDAEGISTDGTRELLLEELGERLELIDAPNLDQVTKRNHYFRPGRVGDLYVMIDADEVFEGLELLRQAPSLDVGWVQYTSPLYARPQGIPRVWRWRAGLHHAGRHHFLYDYTTSRPQLGPVPLRDDRLVCENQLGGVGYDHRLLEGIRFKNLRGHGRPGWRRAAARRHRRHQADAETEVSSQATGSQTAGIEPLRVLQLGPLDPGFVIYRLSSAINTTTPHASAFSLLTTVPDREEAEELVAPVQYTHRGDLDLVRELAASADVLHCHRDPHEFKNLRIKWDPAERPLVFHHHGTVYRTAPWKFNRYLASLRLVSNLELLQYADAGEGVALEYLPNPVPVARYRRFARSRRPHWKEGDPFLVGHSPTMRAKKGTEQFLRAVERLQASGLPIEPVLIENSSHRASLEAKARCHAFFDSFWLGIQCSGLEAAAMGLPVIAGDHDCLDAYKGWLGALPYTWANTEAELVEAIEFLFLDHDHYLSEAARVGQYVERFHDYPAVARHYLELLDRAVGWRSKLSIGGYGHPATHEAGGLRL